MLTHLGYMKDICEQYHITLSLKRYSHCSTEITPNASGETQKWGLTTDWEEKHLYSNVRGEHFFHQSY